MFRSAMAASCERTFIAIKPDGVQRGLVGEIIKRFEQKGFRLVAMKFVHVSRGRNCRPCPALSFRRPHGPSGTSPSRRHEMLPNARPGRTGGGHRRSACPKRRAAPRCDAASGGAGRSRAGTAVPHRRPAGRAAAFLEARGRPPGSSCCSAGSVSECWKQSRVLNLTAVIPLWVGMGDDVLTYSLRAPAGL